MIRYLALIGILATLGNTSLIANSEPKQPEEINLEYESTNQAELLASTPISIPSSGSYSGRVVYAHTTGYSSTPGQTDDTPFITASGTHVRPGTVAANWLPIGTKVKIPEYFGDQVFVVEDRMNRRFNDRLDIWFSDIESARNFGKHYAKIVIL